MSRTFALADAAKVIHEFTLAYGQPYGLSSGATEELAKQWAKVLNDCDPRDVQVIVDRWLKANSKWPAASRIREDVFKLEGSRKQHATNFVDGEFCPRCHTRELITVTRLTRNPYTGQDVRSQRSMPLHAMNCPGLHDDDRTDLRSAIDAGASVWRHGGSQEKPSTPERLARHQQRELAEVAP
jgi:hypothetical protein